MSYRNIAQRMLSGYGDYRLSRMGDTWDVVGKDSHYVTRFHPTPDAAAAEAVRLISAELDKMPPWLYGLD